MCCLVAAVFMIGPRFGILFWWLIDSGRWQRSFDSFLWPLLGFVVLPWTTLAYVLCRPGGINWFDYVILAIAFAIDLTSWGSGGRNRAQVNDWRQRYA